MEMTSGTLELIKDYKSLWKTDLESLGYLVTSCLESSSLDFSVALCTTKKKVSIIAFATF